MEAERRHIPMISVAFAEADTGKQLTTLQLHISDAIRWLRREVAAAVGLPVERTELIFKDRALVDRGNVTHAGIRDGDIVYVAAVR